MTGHLNRLATEYRPQEFSEVVGHELSVRALEGMVSSGDLPTGLLFTGASGSGKTTLARIISQKLNADLVEVDAASHGGVADVRKLTDTLRFTSGGSYKVLIIDECHSLSRDAFNALLKTIEEPPPGVLFILVTTDPHKVPNTVRTRLVEFEFLPLTPKEILTRMLVVAQSEEITLSADLYRHIATHSEGSVRKALTSMGLSASAGISTLEDFLAVSGVSDHSVDLLQFMERQDLDGMYSLLDTVVTQVSHPQVVADQMVQTLRDLLIIRGKGSVSYISDRLPEKEDLARILVAERVFAMLRIMWDLKTQVRTKSDPRVDLELVMVLLYEIVNKGREEKQVIVPTVAPQEEDNQELSLDDMRKMQ